jgi:hypothetical protein
MFLEVVIYALCSPLPLCDSRNDNVYYRRCLLCIHLSISELTKANSSSTFCPQLIFVFFSILVDLDLAWLLILFYFIAAKIYPFTLPFGLCTTITVLNAPVVFYIIMLWLRCSFYFLCCTFLYAFFLPSARPTGFCRQIVIQLVPRYSSKNTSNAFLHSTSKYLATDTSQS